MSSVKSNIVANLIGRTWGSIIGIVVVPVYIHFIGIEVYGLLGVFTIFQTILGLLDMGLSPTLNRELAKNSVVEEGKQYMNDLLFTMERIVLVISVLGGLSLILASNYLSHHWVKAETLNTHTVAIAFVLMAINFAIQFSFGLYQGGYMGLQKQVTLNVILFCTTTIKSVGAILVLYFISPTIIAFLILQIVVNVVQLFFLRKYLWRFIPKTEHKPFFNKEIIKKSGRYAAGIFTISILSILLTQIDKIVLSKTIKLSQYGYYTLAITIAGALTMVLYPITSAIFPKMSEYIGGNRMDDLKAIFHKASQLVVLAIMPITMGIFIFSNDLLFAWTRNEEIAANAGPILQFLILGTAFNSLMTIPYQYTLSVGWLRYGINVLTAGIIVFVPLIIFAATHYGAKGCAFMLMALDMTYFIFAMTYLFNNHLKTEKIKWYFTDTLRPIAISVAVATPFFLIHQYVQLKNIYFLMLFCCCVALCFIATLFFGTPNLKADAIVIVTKLKSKYQKKTA